MESLVSDVGRLGKISGQIFHYIDCTWCMQLIRVPRPKKVTENDVHELCALTRRPVPEPNKPARCCAKFAVRGCRCSKCATNGSLS